MLLDISGKTAHLLTCLLLIMIVTSPIFMQLFSNASSLDDISAIITECWVDDEPHAVGSYILTYYTQVGPWPKKVAEIYISAEDAEKSGAYTYVTLVELLAEGGEKVAGYLPIAGDLFGFAFKMLAEGVAGNPDGSFDFTAIEVSHGVGWFYGGSLSKGTLFYFPLSWYPIPIPLFKLSTPGYFELHFEAARPNLAQITSQVEILNNFIKALNEAQELILTFHSPVNVIITDIYGRVMSETLNEIPNTRLEHYITGAKVFHLPTNLTYNVQVEAYNEGNCTIVKIMPISTELASLSQTHFNLTANTIAKFNIEPGEAEYLLHVDETGDGETDYILQPEINIIPEFPSALILPLFIVASMLAVVSAKKKRLKKTQT